MSINNLRQRITSAYPSWDKWSQLQKQLLLLRSTHGEYWRKDAMDNTANILITEQYDRLKEIAKIFNVDRGDIGKAIKDDEDLQKALEDYGNHNCYRYGKTKRGKKMKRRCSAKDLLELMLYEAVPSSIFAVLSSSRPRLLGIETENLNLWTEGMSLYRNTTGDEGRHFADEVSYAQQVADARTKGYGKVSLFQTEEPDYSADGLPDFEVKSGLHEFEQNIDPKSLKVDKEEDDLFE